MKRSEGGFALVAVLLVLGLLGIIGAEFGYSMRLEAEAMRTWRDNMRAAHLAEAGVAQALRELSGDYDLVNMPFDGVLTFYKKGPPAVALPRLIRTKARLGPGEFTYRITDEQGRLNINALAIPAQTQVLDKLLQCLGIDKINRDQIVDSILDWVDTNDEHRLNGAESDDHYLKLPVPYRARNGPMESINELLQIKGVTPTIFEGLEGRPGLRDVVTVYPRGQGGIPVRVSVNVNTAGPVVFCAMGVGEGGISSIMQRRLETPMTQLPPEVGTTTAVGAFAFTSSAFRIEAEGFIEGRLRASVTAIAQKGQDGTFAVREWSGVR